jgi:hypothetical protein
VPWGVPSKGNRLIRKSKTAGQPWRVHSQSRKRKTPGFTRRLDFELLQWLIGPVPQASARVVSTGRERHPLLELAQQALSPRPPQAWPDQ